MLSLNEKVASLENLKGDMVSLSGRMGLFENKIAVMVEQENAILNFLNLLASLLDTNLSINKLS